MMDIYQLEVGHRIVLGPYTVSREAILEFAREFDPQPFHLDDQAAKATMLGGLAASGWHVAAIVMRMLCDAFISGSSSQGAPGLDEMNWLYPVRPGDVLVGHTIVESKRVSRSRPELGIVGMRHEVFNQHGNQVYGSRGSGYYRILDASAGEISR